MKKPRHTNTREHALEQVRAHCVHAIVLADQFAESAMPAEQKEELARLLYEEDAHLELVVRLQPDIMRAELRLVQAGKTQAFHDPLLKVESALKG